MRIFKLSLCLILICTLFILPSEVSAMGTFNYLWVSNAPHVGTGYGQQSAIFTPMIKGSGRGISIFAFFGIEGAPMMNPDGILMLPRVGHPFGNDVVAGHYQNTKSDITISLIDPHALDPNQYAALNWCAWTPVDCTPVFAGNVNALKSARWVWSMSQHGHRELTKAGFEPIYVPHGIKTDVFKPANRDEARKLLSAATGVDFANKFVVAMNSANKGTPSRKGFYEAFAAFKAISDKRDDAMLYLHGEMNGIYNGENLPGIAEMVGIDPAKIVFAPQYHFLAGYLLPDFVNAVYNAADVFLSTTHGEGFGIPIIEAQAAGCPVIVPDASATSELCITGQKVPTITYMPVTGTTWERPIVSSVVGALEWAYAKRGDDALRNQARAGVMHYDHKHVFATYMQPALEKMEADYDTLPKPQKVMRKRIYEPTVQPHDLLERAEQHELSLAVSTPGANGVHG
jgi:glycosyltransferase involved in cell wall biosynthesis